jgi:hypothetical protein
MVSFDEWAQFLTWALREQDGGLPGVEALTLPYSKGQFEVACKVAIESKVKEWASKTMKSQPSDQLVEKAYFVGTTVDQCLEVNTMFDSLESAIAYDDTIMVEQFQDSFKSRLVASV